MFNNFRAVKRELQTCTQKGRYDCNFFVKLNFDDYFDFTKVLYFQEIQ